MSTKRFITHAELEAAASCVASSMITEKPRHNFKIHPVPRGGIPAAYLVMAQLISAGRTATFVIDPAYADYILDDLVDSGATQERYKSLAPNVPFKALITKSDSPPPATHPHYKRGEWLVFPWEASEEKSIDDAFTRLIQFIGEDPTRGGLLETPARMAKAWKFWTSGYGVDPKAVLKTFEDGGEVYDEMVHVRNIPFYSQCEHHLAPFFGHVTFAYIPQKKIVGLSKMNRLVDIFARRLQVQERMTGQIINSFCDHLAPLGAGILVRARHMCVESRGVCQAGVETTTSAFRGVLKSDAKARTEFLELTK